MRRRTTRVGAVLALAVTVAGAAMLSAAALARTPQPAVQLETVAVGSLARGARSSQVRLPLRADLLGATWRGAANEVELRAQGPDGRWSGWVELHAGDDGPDPGSVEARAAHQRTVRRTASSPVWVGAADRVQVRAHGAATATDVRVVAINATGSATARDRIAGRVRSSAAWVLGASGLERPAAAQPYAPGIHTRASWQAAKPRTAPSYADEGVLGAVVHHTAGTNRYTCAQVPALLRGIQRYHMQSNGWNDIGYNFLVDACGGVWEGRAGGVTRSVIGAHTAGFNTGTAGIALIGTHASVRPTLRARTALRKLVAWRLDVDHVKPTGRMLLTARSSDKFPVGTRVNVRAVSGHRDLFPTSCPGALANADLNSLARDAWAIGGAKVAGITRTSALRNAADPLDPSLARVSIRAIASHPDMFLTVRLERISTGELLHQAQTTGTVISTTWTPPAEASVPAWDVRVAVNGARASGQRARAALLPLVTTAPDPGFVVTTPPAATIVPGGDPADDALHLQYTLARDYRVGAWLHDPATGAQVAVLAEPEYVGTTTTPRDWTIELPSDVPPGNYELRVGAAADPAAGRSIRRFPITVQPAAA